MFRFFRRRKPAPSSTTPGQQLNAPPSRSRIADAPYLLPSDFEESNRLDMQHFLLRTAFHSDVLAPIMHPHGILDVGCGTGRWARELALRFGDANVVGFDMVEPAADLIAKQQAALGKLPENYLFVQGNALKGLPFDDRSFDYVHLRFLALAIPQQSWPFLVQEMLRVATPGGWVELVEFNTPLGGGPAFQQVIRLWDQLGATFKMEPRNADQVGRRLREAGAINVQEKRVAVNTADRQDRAAKMCAVDLDAGIESSGAALVKLGLTNPEELQRLRMAARAEFTQPEYNVRWEFCAAFGQRGA